MKKSRSQALPRINGNGLHKGVNAGRCGLLGPQFNRLQLHDMILVIDNPKESTGKWLEPIKEFSKIIDSRTDKANYIPITMLQSLMESKIVFTIPLIIYFMNIYLATTA